MISAIRKACRKRFERGQFVLGVKLCKFDCDWLDSHGQWHNGGKVSLMLFGLWIYLWTSRNPPRDPDGQMDSWGIKLYERSLYVSWGARHKSIYLPWMFDFVRTEVMLENGAFVEYERYTKGSFTSNPEPENRYRRVVPYRYVCQNGTIQDVQATITVERMTWRWRLAKRLRLPWPRKVRTSICIEFSDEVGEGRGSWKGGCIGCGWDLHRGENPIDALRRMEKERRFKR